MISCLFVGCLLACSYVVVVVVIVCKSVALLSALFAHPDRSSRAFVWPDARLLAELHFAASLKGWPLHLAVLGLVPVTMLHLFSVRYPLTASKRASKQASETASKRASKQASSPASKRASKQASKPASKPASKQVSEPASKRASQQASQQASKQASKPASQLASEPASQQASERASKPASKASKASKPVFLQDHLRVHASLCARPL